MSSLSHDSSIGLLEFLGFPKGSLWEHFSDIWVSIGLPLGPFGYPLGVYWIPLGTLWIPVGTLCTPLGSLWQSLAPLGPYFGDFGIILGPSDCRKGPKSDEERCWDVVFVNSLIHSASLDEKRTLTGAVTTCLPL